MRTDHHRRSDNAPAAPIVNRHSLDAQLCAHELFEKRAALSPSAIAIRQDGFELSYGELNARANRLAQTLIEAGAGPDRLVALCAQRGFALPVAVLATFKAGAA